LSRTKSFFSSPNTADPKLEAFTSDLRWTLNKFLHALKEVVERKYWRRAWIMQEMTAARQLKVWCGHTSIDYEVFVSILHDMERLRNQGCYVGLTVCHRHILGLDRLKLRWKADEAVHLLEALRDSYNTLCSDKLDEVYALLGMCFNADRFIPIVDYSIGMGELLLNMTENHITSSGSLDLICMQTRCKSAFVLPSWAPDWRLIGQEGYNLRMIAYLIGDDGQLPEIHPGNLLRPVVHEGV
jgi:hypothetical protein